MSTKPTNDARWDSNGTNLIAPTSGHKDDGYSVDEIPASSEINGQLNRIGLWTTWLLGSEMTTEVANYSLTASVDDADLAGTGNTTNIHTIYVTPSADDWRIFGMVGGVDRREIRIVNVHATRYFLIRHEAASSTAANRFLFPTHLTGASTYFRLPPNASIRLRYVAGSTNRWVCVEMTGCMHNVLYIVPSAAAALGLGSSTHGAGHVALSGVTTLHYPIFLKQGSIIDSWTVFIKKSSGGGVTITGTLYSRPSNSDTTTSISTDTDNSVAPGYTSVTNTVTYTIPDTNTSHFITLGTDDVGTNDLALHATLSAWVSV